MLNVNKMMTYFFIMAAKFFLSTLARLKTGIYFILYYLPEYQNRIDKSFFRSDGIAFQSHIGFYRFFQNFALYDDVTRNHGNLYFYYRRLPPYQI